VIHKHFALASFAALSCLTAMAAQAATEDFYLTIPGVTGDVVASGHEGTIQVTSFSEAFSAASGNDRAACHDLKILKVLDSTSPKLAMAVATGVRYPAATLQAVSAGKDQVNFLTFTLNNVLVSSISFGGDSDTSARTETVTLHPASVKISYRPQRADGTLGTPIESMVDCSNGGR
jgi:type VI secretion system secreted protein Hcp